MTAISRRSFLANAALSSGAVALSPRLGAQQAGEQMAGMNHADHSHAKPERPTVPRLPALICKVTSTIPIDESFRMLRDGGESLDAALHICKSQEDDPKDHSTGLSGLPNSAGEVQLDACCLHGPTRRFAAVSGLSGIRNASLVARALMDEAGSGVLVGADAKAFALAHGFENQDLLTDRTRKNYLLWKEITSGADQPTNVTYDPSLPEPVRRSRFIPASQKELDLLVHRYEALAKQTGISPELTWRAVFDSVAPASEPVHVSAIDRKGQLSAVSTSSGLPWRKPGVMSDVATIGAGCFVDPDVGSAGSSGNAEANIKIAGAHTIIENMRMGMSPEEAGMDALRRIVRAYNNDMKALRFVDMVYYILRKDGAYGGVSLWDGDRSGHSRQFTIMDAEDIRRTEDCAALFPCGPMNGCGLRKG